MAKKKSAVLRRFDTDYGRDESKLDACLYQHTISSSSFADSPATGQRLCADVGVTMGSSITQCKKVRNEFMPRFFISLADH
jgi:hypothetical protein